MGETSPAKGRPDRIVIEGRYCRLEPLSLAHAKGLYAATGGDGEAGRYKYLFETAPLDEAGLATWIGAAARLEDPMHFAVVDRASGQAGGRQALMRVTPEHGVIEIGSILWGRGIAKTPSATEALFLFVRYGFETLGYRRFEWKCDARNEPSIRAAKRFGFSFEGIFRQHMIIKGANRDTAWFAMLDRDWPQRKAGFESWLDPANFTADGRQREQLRLT